MFGETAMGYEKEICQHEMEMRYEWKQDKEHERKLIMVKCRQELRMFIIVTGIHILHQKSKTNLLLISQW